MGTETVPEMVVSFGHLIWLMAQEHFTELYISFLEQRHALVFERCPVRIRMRLLVNPTNYFDIEVGLLATLIKVSSQFLDISTGTVLSSEGLLLPSKSSSADH
jgi:hypothetical protein